MNELSIPDDAADKPAPRAECRMSAPPGPVKGYRAGGTTYVGREGQTIFVPADHRGALLRAGWSDCA